MITPQIQETPDIKKMQKTLIILFSIDMILIICKLEYPQIAFNELLQNLLLICGTMSLNFCLIVFYVIFLFFNSLMILQIVGIAIQKALVFDNQPDMQKSEIFFFIILILTIIFNLIASFYCFKAYKKLKKAFFDRSSNNTNYIPLIDKISANNTTNQNPSVPKKKEFKAFQGDGIKIG